MRVLLKFVFPLLVLGVGVLFLALIIPKVTRFFTNKAADDAADEKRDEMAAAKKVHGLAEEARRAAAEVAGEGGDEIAQMRRDGKNIKGAVNAGRRALSHLNG